MCVFCNYYGECMCSLCRISRWHQKRPSHQWRSRGRLDGEGDRLDVGRECNRLSKHVLRRPTGKQLYNASGLLFIVLDLNGQDHVLAVRYQGAIRWYHGGQTTKGLLVTIVNWF